MPELWKFNDGVKIKMNNTINRDTVLDLINDVKRANGFKDYSYYEYLFDQVDNMPMSVLENNVGKWLKEETIHGWDGFSYQCSECGRSIHLDTEVEDLTDYPYCHCGAEMERMNNGI